MSNRLRDDNECQNCGHAVEVAFCSKCGQKNVETRQTFPRLVGHFAEDLTHYDTAFWRTLRDLLLKPGRVVKTYLEGRRQCYVPPVKLYIFVSFVTFFLIAVMANPDEEDIPNLNVSKPHTSTEKVTTDKDTIHVNNKHYTSVGEIRKDYEEGEIPYVAYKFYTAMMKAKDVSGETFVMALINTLPKALFLYMPVFTFWLWLFHSKKRWYFFDHGIFTLYYFSFLLLLITIGNIIGWSTSHIFNESIGETIDGWFSFISMIYAFFYFFRSHRRMYGESRAISRLKGFALFFINMFCMFIAMLIVLYFAMTSIH